MPSGQSRSAASKKELSASAERIAKLEEELKAVKAERAQADDLARQIRAKLSSMETKLTMSEKELKAAVAMVGKAAVAMQFSTGTEVRTPVNSAMLEEVKQIVENLSQSVQEELKQVKNLIDRSIIITNMQSPALVLSAQLLGWLIAQGLLPKI